jgi:hypothetical protein
LWTSPTYVNTGSPTQTNAPWHFDLDILCQKTGIGISAVSTSLTTTGFGGWSPAVTPAVGAVPNFGPVPGSVFTTFDSSVNQFICPCVTFGTGSASNTCTMTSCFVYGMN